MPVPVSTPRVHASVTPIPNLSVFSFHASHNHAEKRHGTQFPVLWSRLARRISVALCRLQLNVSLLFLPTAARGIIRSSPQTGETLTVRFAPLPSISADLCRCRSITSVFAQLPRRPGSHSRLVVPLAERRTRLTPLPRWLPQAESIGFLTGVIVGRGSHKQKGERVTGTVPFTLQSPLPSFFFFFPSASPLPTALSNEL